MRLERLHLLDENSGRVKFDKLLEEQGASAHLGRSQFSVESCREKADCPCPHKEQLPFIMINRLLNFLQ